MRLRTKSPLFGAFALLLMAGGVGCSGGKECSPRVVTSEQSCSTTADCNSAGFTTLSCVDELCQRPCVRDADCKISDADPGDPITCADTNPPVEPAVCERQLCQLACTEGSCPAGQVCAEGRCSAYYEGFELQAGQVRELEIIGFNMPPPDPSAPDRLSNPNLDLAFAGLPECDVGDTDCAGTAARGQHFALIATQPADAKGTADVDFTCASCACCLECVSTEYNMDPNLPPPEVYTLANCPVELTIPVALMCFDPVPSHCTNVCQMCETCPAAPAPRVGERLASCEVKAAERACASCQLCDTEVLSCQTSMCATECNGSNQEACADCVDARCLTVLASCLTCNTCPNSVDCLADPARRNSAECIQTTNECAAQGNDGCYATPVNYPRSSLTDLEQAMVSPAIDLSGVSGSVEFSFLFVSFDVGISYVPPQQGVDPMLWVSESQQVELQFCGGNCGVEMSWSAAALSDGSPAAFPDISRRGNGLLLGSQTLLDWESGRATVAIPDAVKTAEFRYRFVPRLDEDARFGIDDVSIRGVQ